MPKIDESPPLLPRRLLFGNPERSVVRISPDGTRIAFRAAVEGILNVWVASLDVVDGARPVTAITERNIGPAIQWMHDSRHIVFYRDHEGDENWRTWRVDIETGDVRPLTPGPGVKSYIHQTSRHFPHELLIAHNERDKRYFDIDRVNVATGESTLIQGSEGFAGFVTDQQFRVRYAIRNPENGDREFLERGADGEWQPVVRIDAEDTMTSHPVEFSDDGRELYWLDGRGRDTAAVVAQDLDKGAIRVLAEDPKADIEDLVCDPRTDRPIAAYSEFERVRWHVLDPDYEEDFNVLARVSAGDLTLVDLSQDSRNWIVAFKHDNAPTEYFHYVREAKQARRLFSQRPELEGVPLVPMEPHLLRSRPGEPPFSVSPTFSTE